MTRGDLTDEYPLHKAVFHNDVKQVQLLLPHVDPSGKDVHGNTPLHLAVMLGHTDCVYYLLKENASVMSRNKNGWSVLAEAVSYGDRPTLRAIVARLRTESKEEVKRHMNRFRSVMHTLNDFYTELRLDFVTWIPFVSTFLPSDVCKIYKKGTSLRVDTTLLDFNGIGLNRVDMSLIFNADAPKKDRLILLDNQKNTFRRVNDYERPVHADIDGEVDFYLSTEMIVFNLKTSSMVCTKKTGWLFNRHKKGKVGPYDAEFYDLRGLSLEFQKRRDHLNTGMKLSEDLSKEKLEDRQLLVGVEKAAAPMFNSTPQTQCNVNWVEYLNAPPGNPPTLARAVNIKKKTYDFRATIAMTNMFPLTIENIIDLIKVCAPFKHLQKVKDFCELNLPNGFPVQFEVPVMPTLSMRVTFQNFCFKDSIDEKVFEIPSGYTEDD